MKKGDRYGDPARDSGRAPRTRVRVRRRSVVDHRKRGNPGRGRHRGMPRHEVPTESHPDPGSHQGRGGARPRRRHTGSQGEVGGDDGGRVRDPRPLRRPGGRAKNKSGTVWTLRVRTAPLSAFKGG